MNFVGSLHDDLGVVVGVDGSPESDAAIRFGVREAIVRKKQLTLLHVVAPVIATWPVIPVAMGITEWHVMNAKTVLEGAARTAHAAAGNDTVSAVRTETRHEAVATALVMASREATMTVIGSRRIGVVRRVLEGSVSGHLIRHGHGAIGVIHDDSDQTTVDSTRPVLLGIDGSPASEAATAFAFDEASRREVDLVALHAWSDTGVGTILGIDWPGLEAEGREVLSERLAGWRERYPDVTVRQQVIIDQPARRLIAASRDAQLVVVGSRGRGGFSELLLGSVGAKVVAGAHSPTVVVRDR